MKMPIYDVDFTAIPWMSPAPGVRYKALQQDGKQLRMVEFSRDFVEPDWCQRGHIGYVVEGELEIDFNGQLITFHAGDGVFIPPGEAHKHKARALTEVATLVLVEDV